MRIVLTGGGTAGHITPHLALLPRLRAQGFDIHYLGTRHGMEFALIEREGVPFHAISAGKLRRYFDWKNLSDLLRIGKGFVQALEILRRLRPDVVFSKGGFVSTPVVWAAWALRIPAIIHESDISPGLANRLSMPFAARVCYSFPETARYLKPGQGVLTGVPVREGLSVGDAVTGRKLCRFSTEQPVILVIGGSQGSGVLNTLIREGLPALLPDFQVCHLCGKGHIAVELAETPGYMQFEYVHDELPHLLALADVIVARAGATTLFEILAVRKANLLIPLSKIASRGDQILNARSFAQQGFSRVLIEEELNQDIFLNALREVYAQRESYIAAMANTPALQAVDAVMKVILGCCKR